MIEGLNGREKMLSLSPLSNKFYPPSTIAYLFISVHTLSDSTSSIWSGVGFSCTLTVFEESTIVVIT